MEQKTHTHIEHPQISASRLADYMAGSEQAKRSIATSCKYRPTIRVIQHNEAKAVVTNWLISGENNLESLRQAADAIRAKLVTSVYEEDLNKHNADYVDAFRVIAEDVRLPGDQLHPINDLPAIEISGVRVTFRPNFMITRVNRRNVAKVGLGFLRYQKNKETQQAVKEWQSALTFGYLGENPVLADHEPEKELCVTLDAFTGEATPAPGKSAYMFKEIGAACAALAERWEAMQPPPGAVF